MKVQREDVVRIPPERLGEDIDALARELTRSTLEGKVGEDKTLTLIASGIERTGEGRIVHGDGAVYQTVKYDAVVFTPQLQEIVDGTVVEIVSGWVILLPGVFEASLTVGWPDRSTSPILSGLLALVLIPSGLTLVVHGVRIGRKTRWPLK